jgi:hypothetical protein
MTYPFLAETIRVTEDGVVTHGIDVPHEAANIPCGQFLRKRIDLTNGGEYKVYCKKRVGHDVGKDEKPHVAVDSRIVAAPGRVVHSARFAPSGIPSGVDQNVVTIPHDCANHLPDTEEVLRRGW